MKKIIFIIGFIIFSFSLSTAQITGGSGHQYKSETSREKASNLNKLFEKGWYLRPEIAISFPLQFEFLFGAGYQINPYLYVGLGTGMGSFHADDHYMTNLEDAPIWYSTTFPLFATFRVNFFTAKNRFTPFFETKIGYSFGIWGSVYSQYWSGYFNEVVFSKEKPTGFYGYFGIGGNYKNLNLLFSYHILGYKFVIDTYHCYDNYWNYDSSHEFNHYFSISLSYNIPLKQKLT